MVWIGGGYAHCRSVPSAGEGESPARNRTLGCRGVSLTVPRELHSVPGCTGAREAPEQKLYSNCSGRARQERGHISVLVLLHRAERLDGFTAIYSTFAETQTRSCNRVTEQPAPHPCFS